MRLARNLPALPARGAGLLACTIFAAVAACSRPAVVEESPQPPAPVADQLARAGQLIQQQAFEEAIAQLEAVTAAAPREGRAWALLGLARHRAGDATGAVEPLQRALDFEDAAPRARLTLAAAYARLGQTEEAFSQLTEAAAGGRVDMTAILIDPDLEPLRKDPRWHALLPSEADFADPFVEPVRVLKEWRGRTQREAFGWIARNLGDADGDGVADVVASAPGAASGAGRIETYSSRSGRLLWSREGEPGAQLGQGLEAAGDVNADGIPDVVAGAPGVERAYILSGRGGEILLTLEAAQAGEGFGSSAAGVGDLDADGHDDVLVGAPASDQAGEGAGRIAVFSGKDGSVLFEALGEQAGAGLGSAGAGSHRNGEGLLVLGAPGAGEGGRGRVYVHRDGAAEPAFVIDAEASGARLGGMFVSVVGDVDGDGSPDVYASDWADGSRGSTTGRIYVHSGRTGEQLLNLTGEAAGDGFGIGSADAGDVDGDGHDDLVVGAWQQGSGAPAGGKVYLYSGLDGSLLRTITCKVQGETFGFDATGMGDVDGDGAFDLLLTSAWSAVAGGRSGRVFLIAGDTP